MYFDFCICETPLPYNGTTLDTIFYIAGDSSYVTPRKSITAGKTYFVYTFSGEGLIGFDGASHQLRANDFMFIQPERNFHYRCLNDAWEFWWFEYTGDAGWPANQIFHCPPNQLIFQLVSQALVYAKINCWPVSSALFCSLREILAHRVNASNTSLRNEQLVQDMESFIKENIQTVTVTDLCRTFQIEERTLRNIFNHTIDMPPKRFIIKTKVELAGYMLLSTPTSLTQIARDLGFANQYHFSKCFKEYFGITPIKYRRHIHL